jgi:dihydropteroate synthase
MKKLKSLSVMAAEPSPAPKLTFLSHRRIWIMGVLNVTPDSFYPGSRATHLETALRLAERMIQEGADCLDIGGESTRPGAEAISPELELERVLPVIEALHIRWPELPLSIDTQKAAVARQCLAHGAEIINDISALRHDPEMVHVAAESDSPIVLMHMRGTPQTMQDQPRYRDVVDEIKEFFEERLAFASRHKIHEERVILDPGIGFGKTLEHNLTILRRLSEFSTFKRPLLIGVSRKSFIGKLLASPGLAAPSPDGRGTSAAQGEALPPEDRLEGSLAAALWAVREGAQGLRVHDVGSTRRALALWEGIESAS